MGKRGVSTLISIILLISIAVSVSMILYLWGQGFFSSTSETIKPERAKSFFSIEGVDPVYDDELDGYYALRALVRNIGPTPGELTSAYIGSTSAISKGDLAVIGGNETFESREEKLVTMAFDKVVDQGLYNLQVASYDSLSAPFQFSIDKALYVGHIVRLETSNDASNKVTAEDEYATYEWWVSSSGGNYKIYFRIYAKPGVTISVCREELFANDGEHPDWVGSWSLWHWTSSFTYPNWVGAEWQPVRGNEFPVTVIANVKT